MRRIAPLFAGILLALATAGCGVPAWVPISAVAAADVASVMVFGRSMGDIVYSAVSGRDCSVVRLDTNQTYCVPQLGPLPPQQFCTHSLGNVDCWVNPWALNDNPRPLADEPTPTPLQDAYRTARWPKSLTAPTSLPVPVPVTPLPLGPSAAMQ
jgi:hypothetical protein